MEFEEFLREVAPLLGLQWRPFRKKGVKRKIERRISEVGLQSFEEYLEKAKKEIQEQSLLSKLLTVTISRFFRDKDVFDILGRSILPNLLKEENKREVKIWCIGCASGEEPYSLALLWREAFEQTWPQVRLSILATDIDEKLLERAKRGTYKNSSLKEVPEGTRRRFFKKEGDDYLLNPNILGTVEFKRHDVLRDAAFLGMDLVLCRNLAFTYFSKESQIEVLGKIALGLKKKRYLVIGKDESLPLAYPTLFIPVFPNEKIYEKFN